MSGSGFMDNATTNLGYQCGCDSGYHLAPNNHDCVGMNIAIAMPVYSSYK